MHIVDTTVEGFRRTFGADPALVAVAPGRVNLIGEHTDYNDGFVLPVAIGRSVAVAAGPRPGFSLSCHSLDFQATATADLSALVPRQADRWMNYLCGVASVLGRRGFRLGGMNCVVHGDVPLGAGLSSSAAMEVACCTALNSLNGLALTPEEVAGVSREAEITFVGVACGIMDQYISVMARPGHAMLLDCRSLEHRHVPFPEGYAIVIADTGVRRELAASGYNDRHDECLAAVAGLKKAGCAIESLRDCSPRMLSSAGASIPETLRKRARHVITENTRVERFTEALERRAMDVCGKLMNESHISLKDDYAVSIDELDVITEIARTTEGVSGARMTGAGFGGCAVALVEEAHAARLTARLLSEYPRLTGRQPACYTVIPAEGAGIISPWHPGAPRKAVAP